MFESYETLMEQKLAQISDKRDRRQGSLIYDALAPNAAETAAFYADLSFLEDRSYADSATGEDLSRRCAERGIFRKAATNAVWLGQFQDAQGNGYDVPIGSRFFLNEMGYCVRAQRGEGLYELTCETAGEAGNDFLGALLPLEYMEGLAKAELTELLEEGNDEEADDVLRKRYLDSLQADAFGGNVADYKSKMEALEDVGGVKVYPVYYGGGTVRLVVLDRSWDSPSEELLEKLQEEVDPQSEGKGYGFAPIGHKVTVEGAEEKVCGLSLQILTQEGQIASDLTEKISQAAEEYLLSLRKEWAASEKLIVRRSHLESRLLEISGILDISSCYINGQETNEILTADQIPVLGQVEVSVGDGQQTTL